MKKLYFYSVALFMLVSCGKDKGTTPKPPDPVIPDSFSFSALKVNDVSAGFTYNNINTAPEVRISFSESLNKSSVAGNITFKSAAGTDVAYKATYADGDKTVIIKPSAALQNIAKYTVAVNTGLKSVKDGNLLSGITVQLMTVIDSANKFPVITDAALLDKVQRQTFKYFWDFGHPTSGLARERNTSGDVVTSGGSGFGIMAIVTGVSRGYITREQGLERVQKITSFLKNNAAKFHGAFPHWLNGTTGVVVPFSADDNGADLVETAYLIEGLLTARQYFTGGGAEATLRSDINAIWDGVEWDWFRQGDQNVLYWHWSPDKGWTINMQIKGWNEALIIYALAASSNTHAIPKTVYENGWAGNGSMKNGSSYYGIQLPLGPAQGGPLFFEHYSFLGIDPNGLTDAYANYETQTKAHTLINHNYCVANPKNYVGYSADCWGLTASDIKGGYTASSPTNDVGFIAPTAAISSMPYTPDESMKALKFFYYKLGDKLWGEYGFYDAFSLNEPWFADSYLAIDQGPIIVMIENYRTGLLWDLFMSCPEVKNGMKDLGFSGPHL
ncbi:MAG: beta-glucosidase [Sphingobacteriales bacterium]|nr:MAG: beta-glucosidase [Sphingobacteriales bacterium]